jgi:CoA:oxalate CoA-transferase
VDVEHPIAGSTKLPGIPIKLDKTPGEIKEPAPILGQHTGEILREILGYDAEEIARLEENGIF